MPLTWLSSLPEIVYYRSEMATLGGELRPTTATANLWVHDVTGAPSRAPESTWVSSRARPVDPGHKEDQFGTFEFGMGSEETGDLTTTKQDAFKADFARDYARLTRWA